MSETSPVAAKEKVDKADKGKSALNRREIPVSSYDFLNGAYKTAARARTTALSVGAVMTAIALVLGFQGWRESRDVQSVQNSLDTLTLQNSAALQEFGTLTGVTGVSERDLLDRDKVLSRALLDSLSGAPDVILLLSQVQQSAAALGIVVESVTMNEKTSSTAPSPSASASASAAE